MNDDDTQTAAAPKTRKPKTELPYVVGQWLPGSGVENFVASASITATKE